MIRYHYHQSHSDDETQERKNPLLYTILVCGRKGNKVVPAKVRSTINYILYIISTVCRRIQTITVLPVGGWRQGRAANWGLFLD